MMIIGIDPDLEASGVAIVEDRLLVEMFTVTFMGLHKYVSELSKSDLDVVFVVEDVEKNRALYAKHTGQTALVRERIAQNVGQVKAVCRLIQQLLDSFKMSYKMASPIRGHLKKAKTDREYFNKITGWTGSSNADKRDAALIALYGVPFVRLIHNA